MGFKKYLDWSLYLWMIVLFVYASWEPIQGTFYRPHTDYLNAFVLPIQTMHDALVSFSQLPLWNPRENFGTATPELLSLVNPFVTLVSFLLQRLFGSTGFATPEGWIYQGLILSHILVYAPACGLLSRYFLKRREGFFIGFFLGLFSGFFYISVMFISIHLLFWPLFIYAAVQFAIESSSSKLPRLFCVAVSCVTMSVFFSMFFLNSLSNALIIGTLIYFCIYGKRFKANFLKMLDHGWQAPYGWLCAFVAIFALTKYILVTELLDSVSQVGRSKQSLLGFIKDVSGNSWRHFPIENYLKMMLDPFWTPENSYSFGASIGTVAIFIFFVASFCSSVTAMLFVSLLLMTLIATKPTDSWNYVAYFLSQVNPVYHIGTRFISAAMGFSAPLAIAGFASAVSVLYPRQWKYFSRPRFFYFFGIVVFAAGVFFSLFDFFDVWHRCLVFSGALVLIILTQVPQVKVRQTAYFLLLTLVASEVYLVHMHQIKELFYVKDDTGQRSQRLDPVFPDSLHTIPLRISSFAKYTFVSGSVARLDYLGTLKTFASRAFFISSSELGTPLRFCHLDQCESFVFKQEGENLSWQSLPVDVQDASLLKDKITYLTEEALLSYNSAQFRTHSEVSGFFVYLDHLNPHWTASVNGVPVQIKSFNSQYKMISLNAGESVIEFELKRPFFSLLYLLSFLLSIAFVIYAAYFNLSEVNFFANKSTFR